MSSAPPDGLRQVQRCGWAATELDCDYHDREWGVPVHDDRLLFELLILEGAQAELSWQAILRTRANYRAAFAHFDPHVVARFDQQKINELLTDPGIVRNRLKINAAICNARAFLAMQHEFSSFNAYIWRFVGGQPRKNTWRTLGEVPARTSESDVLSKDLKGRGFTFVGSTIGYAFTRPELSRRLGHDPHLSSFCG